MEAELPHVLQLEERSRLTLTGVGEVVRFEETAVVLHTALGPLTVHGQELRLKTLLPEGGQMTVEGKISALVYGEPQRSGWLGRLFG